jgi:hypothetical protein
VQIGVEGKPCLDEIYEGFESLAFAIAVVCPESVVLGLRAIKSEDAEEKLQAPSGLEKGVPLKIENHVTPGSLRQSCKAAPAFDWEHLTLDPFRTFTLEL